MIERLLASYSNKFVSRHFVLAIDVAVISGAFVMACLLRIKIGRAQV